jgi:hypothetical protein
VAAQDDSVTVQQAQFAVRFMLAVASLNYENINGVPLWRLLCRSASILHASSLWTPGGAAFERRSVTGT